MGPRKGSAVKHEGRKPRTHKLRINDLGEGRKGLAKGMVNEQLLYKATAENRHRPGGSHTT